MSKFYLDSIRDSQNDYIDDPWIFLRELAQNSRDSGALRIKIDPGGEGSGNEVIIFSDNGKGMTFREAEKYLFRLYSSSKFKERTSVGMYGIGFWTVMKFDPDKIIIESYSEEEDKWAVTLDSDLNHKRTECKLGKFGTRVTLIRKKKYPDYEYFCDELEKGVRNYCRFIDRKSEKDKMLPVIFRGKLISENLKFDDGIFLKYGDRNFAGIVGLGKLPGVVLLTGGLPAWEGSTLNELSITKNDAEDKYDYIKNGIAPVFHINGRNLKVNMSRKELIDDDSLQKILKRSRKALKELVQTCSDHAYPRSRSKKIWNGVRKEYKNVISSYWKIILAILILVIPVEIFLLNKIIPVKAEEILAPDPVSVEGFRQYSATVDKLGKGVIADIRYLPQEDVWLKMFTAPDFDKIKGFVWNGSLKYVPSVDLKENGGDFKVNIFIRKGGDVFLPHPSGYEVDEGSIRINGVHKVKIKRSGSGEIIAFIPDNNRTLDYTCSVHEVTDDQGDKKYLSIPGSVRFPAEIESSIRKSFYLDMGNKISKSIKLANIMISYDASEGTALYYRDHTKDDWLKKVLEIGAGDCDVINGVLCLILRRSGVRSKLVVGLIGEKGYVLPRLHSWVEYYDNGWKKADATTSFRSGEGLADPVDDISVFRVASDHDNENKMVPLLIKMFFLLLLLSIFPFVLFYRERVAKEREKKAKLNPLNKIKARRDIIEIGKSYLLAPGLWDYNFDIVEQEIITTIQGKNISIKKGFRLLRQKKLFLGKGENPLADALKGSDEVVIDSDNSIQFPLVRLFHGIIDLDMIRELTPDLNNENGTELTKSFLDEVNQVLKKITWKKLSCLKVEGLDETVFRDIDLTSISYRKFFKRTGYPGEFIALNVNAPEIEEIIDLYGNDRDLALYRFFRKVVSGSRFFYSDKDVSSMIILRTILKNG